MIVNTMKKQIFDDVKLLWVLTHGDFRLCKWRRDDIYSYGSSSIARIQALLWTSACIDYTDEKGWNIEVYEENFFQTQEYLIIKILKYSLDEVKDYLKNYIKGYYYYSFQYFFSFFHESHFSYFIREKYIKGQTYWLLRDILFILNGAFVDVSKKNVYYTVLLLEKLKWKYPHTAILFLLSLRQQFEYMYRYHIGKKRFNVLVENPVWNKKICEYPLVKKIFEDICYCQKQFSDPLFELFIGKIYLHFLQKRGIQNLKNYLQKKNLSDDENVCSWLWVYYLQIWEYHQARYYLNKMKNFPWYELYKILWKEVLLDILCNDFDSFMEHITPYEVVFCVQGKFYRFYWNHLVEYDFCDIYDNATKLWFTFTFSYDLFNITDTSTFFKKVFLNISKKYSHHFHFESGDKMIINAPLYG